MTADLHSQLALLGEDLTPLAVVRDETAMFLAACRRDADHHYGQVSANRVRVMLTDKYGQLVIDPRRYSSLWSKHTGLGRAMRKTTEIEINDDVRSGNAGRPQYLRRWVG